MAQAIKKVTLDIMRENNFVYLAKQGDALSRLLSIQLTSSGTPIVISSEDKAVLSGKRADGVSVFVLGTVNTDGTVTVEITSDMIAAAGSVMCDISVISPSGAVLTTLSFVIEVEKGYRDDAAIEAANQFPLFTKAISEMAAVEADIKASEAERTEAEAERAAAEEKRIMTNIRNGEAENSLVGCDGGADSEEASRSLGKGCVSLGESCVSGCMGYYISAIDFDNKKIYLTDIKVEGLPTVGAGVVASDFAAPAYELNSDFSIINGLHYPLCGTITATENNVITYEGDLGFTEFKADTGIDGHVFYVPAQPTVGAVSFVTGAVSFGSNVINVGKCAFGAGRDLSLLEGYGTNIGRGNTTGYGSVALGLDSLVPAQFGVSIGNKNKVTGYNGVALGQVNEVAGDGASAIGQGLRASSPGQAVRGKYNLEDNENIYADIVGNGTSDSNRSNAYTLDKEGNARFEGKVYVESENGTGEGKELATRDELANISQMIGTFEPLGMGTAIEDDGYTLSAAIYNSLTKDILTENGITYIHLEPSSEQISGSSKKLTLDRYSVGSDKLVIPLAADKIYFKMLARSNCTGAAYCPRINFYDIYDADGNKLSNSAYKYMTSEYAAGGEWTEFLCEASMPEGAKVLTHINMQVGGFVDLSSYPEGAYFDVAAWAVFDNAELAQSFDMKAAASGLPGLDFGQRLDLKADKVHTHETADVTHIFPSVKPFGTDGIGLAEETPVSLADIITATDELFPKKADKNLSNVENKVFLEKGETAGLVTREQHEIDMDTAHQSLSVTLRYYAESDLANVSNDNFKQKAIDSGLVDYIVSLLNG